MGNGEPFDNYANVMNFLRTIDDKGLAIGARHITVSTSGLVPKFEFADSGLQVNLAISLHAPNTSSYINYAD